MSSGAEVLAKRLGGWANQIAARYGFPVYLVGSALTETEPRDVDVRVVLSDDAFYARYGIGPMRAEGQAWIGADEQHEGTRRWHADMAKMARQAANVLHVNIDFQVQSESIVLVRRHHEKPRIRIDTLDLSELPPLTLDTEAVRAGWKEGA